MNFQNLTNSQNGTQYVPSTETIAKLSTLPKEMLLYCFSITAGESNSNMEACYERISNRINAIPICLVTSEQQGKLVPVVFASNIENVLVPSEKNSKKRTMQGIDNPAFVIIDPLGIYVRRTAMSQEKRQVIFILVDKIMTIATDQHYQSLVALVILHEMMHAMMDTDIEIANAAKCKNAVIKKEIPSLFNNAEEVMANALAIMFLSRFCTDMDFILSFVRDQPFPYCKAECFFDSEQRLMIEATNWILDKIKYDSDLHSFRSRYEETNNDGDIEIPYYVRYKEFYHIPGMPLPEGSTVIERCFFDGFGGLKKTDIPESVTGIESRAFRGCANLQEVYIPKTIKDIQPGAFCFCPEIERIVVEDGNERYYSKNNCIIERETGVLVLGCKNSVIPQGVTAIGDRAFDGCDTLTDITFPDSVKEIGDQAFLHCDKLQGLVIPATIERIKHSSFYSCGELETITFEGNPELFYQCFAQCRNLKNVIGLSNEPISADNYAFLVSEKTATFDIKGGIEFCEKLEF